MKQYKELTLRDYYDDVIIIQGLPNARFRVQVIAELRDLNDRNGAEVVDLNILNAWMSFGDDEIKIDLGSFKRNNPKLYDELYDECSRFALVQSESIPNSLWKHFQEVNSL